MHVSPVHPHTRRLPPPPQNEETSQEGTLFEAGTSRRFGRCQGDGGELPAAQAEHQTPLCRGRGGHRGVLAPQPEPGEEACGMGCHQPPVRPGQGPAAVLLSFLTKCFREFLNLPKLNSERGDWSFQQPRRGPGWVFPLLQTHSRKHGLYGDPRPKPGLRPATRRCFAPAPPTAPQVWPEPGRQASRQVSTAGVGEGTLLTTQGRGPEATPRRPRPGGHAHRCPQPLLGPAEPSGD